MYAKLASCSLLLHLLILLVTGNGVVKARDHHDHTKQVHSHMHHIDPSVTVFFFLEDLKLGNTTSIYFPKMELSDAFPHLLSKDEADSIPFSSRYLDHLLHRFAFPPDSPQAKAMKDTLEECEREPIEGETKFCATSRESLSDFTKTIFGQGMQIISLSTTHVRRAGASPALLQEYTVMGIWEIPAPKMVACHTMPYAYTVFFCHFQETESRVYRVSLDGENGDAVDAVAVCHMDTSQWGRSTWHSRCLGRSRGPPPFAISFRPITLFPFRLLLMRGCNSKGVFANSIHGL